MGINWLEATIEQRKTLYRVVRVITDATDTDILGVVAQAEATPMERGVGYETNFNHGKISRKLAKVIAQWVEENHRDLAHETAPELFPISMSTIWSGYLADHGIEGRLNVRSKSRSRDLVTFEKEKTPHHQVLALGEPFTFELAPQRAGCCMGYQIYREKWYPFPLSMSEAFVQTDGSSIEMPQLADGSTTHIVERQHPDLHHFVMLSRTEQYRTSSQKSRPSMRRKASSFTLLLWSFGITASPSRYTGGRALYA